MASVSGKLNPAALRRIQMARPFPYVNRAYIGGYQKSSSAVDGRPPEALSAESEQSLLSFTSHTSKVARQTIIGPFGTQAETGFDTPGRLHDFRFITEGLKLTSKVFVDEQIFSSLSAQVGQAQ